MAGGAGVFDSGNGGVVELSVAVAVGPGGDALAFGIVEVFDRRLSGRCDGFNLAEGVVGGEGDGGLAVRGGAGLFVGATGEIGVGIDRRQKI